MLHTIRENWKRHIRSVLLQLAEKKSISIPDDVLDSLPVETPPDPSIGDLAFPMFSFARVLKTSPQGIAQDVVNLLEAQGGGKDLLAASGPYVNITLNAETLAERVVQTILQTGSAFGATTAREGEKIMIEFSCPNTNKPLHLGHLRNDILGESLSRILKANGAEVRKVNLINDRGIHICKSMLAYQRFGDATDPESEGIKSDHFVGKYYVRYNEWAKSDPAAEEAAREMLRQWERGDKEVVALWEKMNCWALEGIRKTYESTGISFDRIYFESETYKTGKDEILKGLQSGVFYRDQEGTVWVDLEDVDLDKKVLLRGDGTSLYLTQDVGTAIQRHTDWPFDTCIYVVGSEQQYHFKVLFRVLSLLGKEWAENLHHLSYGMVNLPEGKMKSREGKVVDADDLVKDLVDMAVKEIQQKGREDDVQDLEETAAQVALGALHYYLLQVSPSKDMIFNPAESISFNGNTGPYLQYMGARISSMERKYNLMTAESFQGSFQGSLLKLEEERTLMKTLAEFPEAVEKAGRELNPSVLTAYLYRLSKVYSKYYHDYPVLRNDDPHLVASRMFLALAVRQVLRNAFYLTGIPFLETM
ncbi:MAG: arginine--tRNA ligase [Spirochaetales bacterium]|nr:arginine--tRNA ligase [Spirochaetales bacterium]